MVLSALVAIALGQGSLFQQVIPNPTGKNGYEELVRACDILRDRHFGAYVSVDVLGVLVENATDAANKGVEPRVNPPAVQAIFDELKGKTLLQRRRWALERYAPALDLFYKAAEKSILDPRTSFTYSTLLPELPGVKDLAKLLPIAAYVYLADGKNPQACHLLATGLDVFERASYGTLIQYLVGIACQSILLAAVEQHLDRFSQADAKKLEAASLALLERPTVARQAIVNEGAFTSSAIEDLLLNPKGLEDVFEEGENQRARQAIDKLSEASKVRLIAAVKQRFQETTRQMAHKFEGPEATWVASDEPIMALKSNWSTEQGVVDALTENFLPAFAQVGIAAARSRTQVRLLGVVASVIRYRWEHNQLPTTLEAAIGKERLQDPLSQLPFELRRDGSAGFTIVSKGTKETGEIALKYRRPTDSGKPGPP